MDKDDKQSVYELFAIVNCGGNNPQEIKYSSIVKRLDKEIEEYEWIEFSKETRVVVSALKALNDSKP